MLQNTSHQFSKRQTSNNDALFFPICIRSMYPIACEQLPEATIGNASAVRRLCTPLVMILAEVCMFISSQGSFCTELKLATCL